MGYHVALELTQEQVKSLKLLATSSDMSVKDFVSELVIKAIKKEGGNIVDGKNSPK